MNFKSNIKTLRLMKGLSQEELGARIGVKRAAVNKYEKGLIEISPIKTIEHLGANLSVPPQDLLRWSDESKKYYGVPKIWNEHFLISNIVIYIYI